MKSGNNPNKYKYNIKKLFHRIKTTFKKRSCGGRKETSKRAKEIHKQDFCGNNDER